jgi:hypothetical protein
MPPIVIVHANQSILLHRVIIIDYHSCRLCNYDLLNKLFEHLIAIPDLDDCINSTPPSASDERAHLTSQIRLNTEHFASTSEPTSTTRRAASFATPSRAFYLYKSENTVSIPASPFECPKLDNQNGHNDADNQSPSPTKTRHRLRLIAVVPGAKPEFNHEPRLRMTILDNSQDITHDVILYTVQ